eukprot:GHVT01007328.1.p1 GENE.GHVT01007328.1~~GHVT01007328.1.p1  ORF type:complete len:105 (-),score=16.98 GHVT01007328.1:197-511(-)
MTSCLCDWFASASSGGDNLILRSRFFYVRFAWCPSAARLLLPSPRLLRVLGLVCVAGCSSSCSFDSCFPRERRLSVVRALMVSAPSPPFFACASNASTMIAPHY